jgi:rod shape-determining protein MreB
LRARKYPFTRRFAPDFGVDLGTAYLRISAPREGIVLAESSMLALSRDARRHDVTAAVGLCANVMHGRTPDSVETIRPVRRGVVADVDRCAVMLRAFLRRVRPSAWSLKPRMLIAIPGDLTPVERHAVLAAASRAGARQVFLVAKAQAGALGAGLPLAQPVASMICDIGAGTADIAILCLGEVAVSETLRVAGDDLTRAIANYLRRRHKLLVGDLMAERAKTEIGTAVGGASRSLEVSGRDVASGMPRKIQLESDHVREAIHDPVRMLVESVERTLERCPPALAADLMQNGMVLAGGGAQLRGLDERLASATGMPVRVAEEPADCVARGLALCLENLELWQGLIQGRTAA